MFIWDPSSKRSAREGACVFEYILGMESNFSQSAMRWLRYGHI
jgi:hypothetical protein